MGTESKSANEEVTDSMDGYRKANSRSQNDRLKSAKLRVSEGSLVPGYRAPVVTTYTEEEILDRLGPARTYHFHPERIHRHGHGHKK